MASSKRIEFDLGRPAQALIELLFDLKEKQGYSIHEINVAIGYVYANVEDSTGTEFGYTVGVAENVARKEAERQKEQAQAQGMFQQFVEMMRDGATIEMMQQPSREPNEIDALIERATKKATESKGE